MKWKMSNEGVQVGDVFVKGFTDEVGHFSTFYKVVEKRGKSIVIVRRIAARAISERKNGEIEIAAVRDLEIGDKHRLRAYVDDEGKTVLWELNPKGWFDAYDRGDISGRSGWYASDANGETVSANKLESVLPYDV